MVFILWISLLFRAVPPDFAADESPEQVILSTDSASVLLPCSNLLWDPKSVDWHLNGSKICSVIDATPRCTSTKHLHVAFAEPDCFGKRDFSLLFTPTMNDGGRYTCGVQVREGTSHILTTHLVVFRVFVTPANRLAPGSSVSLTTEISERFYPSDIEWGIEDARGTAGEIVFQWEHNGALIAKDSRHSWDSTNFNISCFQKKDTGVYTLTITLKGGKATSYSNRLDIEASSPETSKIVGIILAIIGVVCLITTAVIIYKKPTPIQQSQPGNYVNVPLQPGWSNQNASELSSTYMTMNLNEQSLYDQLQR
ncbi:uncharacterized protein [Heptranchias perlo]|uniref:uncharacterized protein isoform X2 n=1 Tax=Heptranchias perlo TaxID=212740 RepID=UPI00355A8D94